MKNRQQLYNEIANGLDVSKINLNDMTRAELIELAYALDWNGTWEDDEEGQPPITKAELIDAITNILEESK
jgi:hypothetical protein